MKPHWATIYRNRPRSATSSRGKPPIAFDAWRELTPGLRLIIGLNSIINGESDLILLAMGGDELAWRALEIKLVTFGQGHARPDVSEAEIRKGFIAQADYYKTRPELIAAYMRMTPAAAAHAKRRVLASARRYFPELAPLLADHPFFDGVRP